MSDDRTKNKSENGAPLNQQRRAKVLQLRLPAPDGSPMNLHSMSKNKLVQMVVQLSRKVDEYRVQSESKDLFMRAMIECVRARNDLEISDTIIIREDHLESATNRVLCFERCEDAEGSPVMKLWTAPRVAETVGAVPLTSKVEAEDDAETDEERQERENS